MPFDVLRTLAVGDALGIGQGIEGGSIRDRAASMVVERLALDGIEGLPDARTDGFLFVFGQASTPAPGEEGVLLDFG